MQSKRAKKGSKINSTPPQCITNLLHCQGNPFLAIEKITAKVRYIPLPMPETFTTCSQHNIIDISLEQPQKKNSDSLNRCSLRKQNPVFHLSYANENNMCITKHTNILVWHAYGQRIMNIQIHIGKFRTKTAKMVQTEYRKSYVTQCQKYKTKSHSAEPRKIVYEGLSCFELYKHNTQDLLHLMS